MSLASAILHSPEQAPRAMGYLLERAQPILQAGERLVASINKETRRGNQNNHYHSLIGQIAEQVGGDLADREDAKRILISAFRFDTRGDPALADEWRRFGELRLGRGLRGEVVMLGVQSRDFTVKLGAAFIHWLYAFGAEHGVVFKAWEGDGC